MASLPWNGTIGAIKTETSTIVNPISRVSIEFPPCNDFLEERVPWVGGEGGKRWWREDSIVSYASVSSGAFYPAYIYSAVLLQVDARLQCKLFVPLRPCGLV